ncbi:MAG: hydrogen peroxide-inducible genes activator [Tidjanibacter sp.]|nr:hydrogen peroxide-inducible genes activator [Tidjanibacter sp.]
MTLQQLEYAVAVDQYRHFVRAAEACGVTQSTLSSMIQKLEHELDMQLFDRDSHPVRPTEAGEKIIAQAKVVLYNASQLREMSLSERGQSSGKIRLGVIPTVAPYILPDLFVELGRRSPDIELRVSEMRTSVIIDKLRLAELDMALLTTPLGHDDLLEVPLYYEKFVAYVSPSEPLYALSEIGTHSMPSKHLWVLQEGHCLRNQVFNFCNHQSDYSAVYEAGSIDTLVRIVDRNGGYTVIPEMHAALLTAEQQLNLRPLVSPEPVREISLVIRRDYVREGLLNALAEAIKQVIPEHMIDARLRRFAIKL